MILVTGATGLNGQAVIREFARHGVPVRALVRNDARAEAIRGLPGVEVVHGDLLQPLGLLAALDGIERALLISSSDSTLVEAQCTFIDAAKKAGVAHIVKFSGAESNVGFVQDNFRYTRNHGQIERYLEGAGLDWTHLRPNQFMQVYLREARAIAATGVLALPAADIELSPVDVADIAQVAFRLLTTDGHEGRIYPMTGPEALTMTQVADLIAEAIGRPVRYENVTPEQRRESMVAAGVPADVADALADQAYGRLRHPQAQVLLETHRTFGVEPTPFASFVQQHKAVFG